MHNLFYDIECEKIIYNKKFTVKYAHAIIACLNFQFS